MRHVRIFARVVLASLLCGPALLLARSDPAPHAAEPRARDIGIPFDGTTGPFNAITDVAGVEVGYKTLISGEGKLIIGKGRQRGRRHRHDL
jgi:D-aminopeptidase